MTQTFEAFLRETRPDADTIQQAARLYLAERCDDLPPDEMTKQLHAASPNPALIEKVRNELAANSSDLETVALAVLAYFWADPDEQEKIRAAFSGAKESLPVIEAIILATVAMYGMWLITTGGVKQVRRGVRRTPGGGTEEFEEVEFYGPPPVGKILGALGSAGES